MTLRDQTWAAVIEALVETGEVKIGDLPFEESQRHTVRRVLREMEELGYLQRESKRARTWRAGKVANENLDLSMRAMVNAGFDE